MLLYHRLVVVGVVRQEFVLIVGGAKLLRVAVLHCMSNYYIMTDVRVMIILSFQKKQQGEVR